MPLQSSSGNLSIGRDCNVVMMSPLAPGGRVDIANVTAFDGKQQFASLESKRMSLPPIFLEIPNGWNGSFEFDRAETAADDLANAAEAIFWAGGSLVNGDFFQYVTNPDGSTSTYHYLGCAFKFTELGRYAADAVVKQRVDFKASQRVPV